jgi:hypothetical protein
MILLVGLIGSRRNIYQAMASCLRTVWVRVQGLVMWGRVDVRWVAGATVALFLLPGQAFAQFGPPGPRPGINRAPSLLPPMTSHRPQVDLLDLRDRHEPGAAVTPLGAAPSTIVCVAGCGDSTSKVAAALPQKTGAFLAVVGPIEDAKLIKAAAVAPAPSEAPAVGDVGVVTCLAGCDASDRRIMQATGGPLPLVRRQPSIPPRFITAAAAPTETAPRVKASAKSPSTTATQIKLKRTHAAHAKRVEKKTKIAARKPSGVQVAQASKPSVAHLSAVGMPTPIQPSQPGQKPQPAVAKPQAVVSPKKPVTVNTSSDWFNKISREQAAKKKVDEAQ